MPKTRLFYAILLVLTFACGQAPQDMDIASVVIADGNGLPFPKNKAALANGDTLALSAIVTNKKGESVDAEAVEWNAMGNNVLELQGAGVEASAKAVKDWFDEAPEEHEPVAKVTACADEVCGEITVNALINLSGLWETTWTNASGDHHDTPQAFYITQNGRQLETAVQDFGTFPMRLTGNRLELTDGAAMNAVLEGTVTSRTTMEGKFLSGCGFAGSWSATKTPER